MDLGLNGCLKFEFWVGGLFENWDWDCFKNGIEGIEWLFENRDWDCRAVLKFEFGTEELV